MVHDNTQLEGLGPSFVWPHLSDFMFLAHVDE